MVPEDNMHWRKESNIETYFFSSEYGACSGYKGGIYSWDWRLNESWAWKKTEIDYLLGDYNVIFLVIEDVFNLPWDWMMMVLDLGINDIWR